MLRQAIFRAQMPMSKQAGPRKHASLVMQPQPRNPLQQQHSTASRRVNDDLDCPGLRGVLKHVVRALHIRQLEAVRDQLARAQAPQRSLRSTCVLFQVLDFGF